MRNEWPDAIAAFKKEAKLIAQRENIKPTHAHEKLAKMYGFNSYNHFLNQLDKDLDKCNQ